MGPEFLQYKNSRIAWYRYGTGPNPVVCFHGYGEDSASYRFLPECAGSGYSFFAIDLPFHGNTKWDEALLFTHWDLLEIIDSIEGLKNREWSVIGYSLGGRVALSLYQAVPERINKMVLLAPDGLKVNFWYWLATQTRPGNWFFALTMKRPGWFLGFLKLLNKIGLINPSIFKFVNYYIGDKQARHLLFTRWTGLAKLKPNLKKIKKLIPFHQTHFRLVYGKHDRIIRPGPGTTFCKGIESYCSGTIIEAGHQLLHKKHGAEIKAALQP